MPDPTPAVLPRYPVYVPSKGRAKRCYTARCLTKDRVPFYLVVRESELETYKEYFPDAQYLVLPRAEAEDAPPEEGLIRARNWIKAHSLANGDERHWQIDDNVEYFGRRWRRRRIRVDGGIAIRAVEDFVDRYTNIGIAGMDYYMFVPDNQGHPAIQWNCHVYSCTLILNSLPYRWRTPLNDDTDMCLQVLAGGYCTLLVNAFLVQKLRTMRIKGGNTEIYKNVDGRLRMARQLERLWPGIVTVDRRFQRPQHIVKAAWKRFDTQPILKEGLTLEALAEEKNEYGMELTALQKIRSDRIQALHDAAVAKGIGR